VVFAISESKESLSLIAGWRNASVTLQQVNEWNRTKRYSRAYLDSDGDPVIELDLDLAGGVTVARVKDFVQTARVSVAAFRMEVLLASQNSK
jgi:hypothetical protein